MAKLKGILKIEGTLQDMTFYKTQDGNLIKTQSGVNGDRIASEATFARTRENGAEFGAAATAGKLMRDTFRVLLQQASDNRVVSRITQLMTQIKNLDLINIRGERVVSEGIKSVEALPLLKGFNFNSKSVLGSVLFKPYTVDTATGIITIGNLVPVNDIKLVAGATHMSLSGAFAIIDFATGINDIQFTNIENLPIDATATPITLTPVDIPTGGGSAFFLLEISYFQEINGVQYLLNNGSFNALSIIDSVEITVA